MLSFVHFNFEICFAPQRRALFRDLNLQKWSEWCVLYILTSKCASRHNSVHFFDISTSKSSPIMVSFVHFNLEMCFAPQRHALFNISTSKSGPIMVSFVHFDLEMCFAPQRRALFRHLNFQKCSETQVFCTFSLGNVLRATTAHSQVKMLNTPGFGPLLEVQISLRVAGARDFVPCQK